MIHVRSTGTQTNTFLKHYFFSGKHRYSNMHNALHMVFIVFALVYVNVTISLGTNIWRFPGCNSLSWNTMRKRELKPYMRITTPLSMGIEHIRCIQCQPGWDCATLWHTWKLYHGIGIALENYMKKYFRNAIFSEIYLTLLTTYDHINSISIIFHIFSVNVRCECANALMRLLNVQFKWCTSTICKCRHANVAAFPSQ